ncbi:Transmembrane amino acid transporter family [Pyrenophora seminiperda CCB06]|uniref:Transmembrane amino acid transporter family n=1 Tax=Pyrenophora seminiperda CCB06 TaxID=1302712 RepID=A0A3M7M1K9_9PLEO|nr:Transmembrane amino acid transporter family [Pyrenophora seminiperda CCB06]
MHATKLSQLLFYLCCLLPLAACITKRSAKIQVKNNTPYDISGVGLAHMYSDVYSGTKTWETIPAGGTSDALTVHYNTGFLTTGRDWWAISWHNANEAIAHDSMSQCYSNPNNFRDFMDFLESVGPNAIAVALEAVGIAQPELEKVAEVAGIAADTLCKLMLNSAKTDGFKQHILREDEGVVTTIQINGDKTINFLSVSGRSDTVWDVRTQDLGL